MSRHCPKHLRRKQLKASSDKRSPYQGFWLAGVIDSVKAIILLMADHFHADLMVAPASTTGL
jgi:hypothetical protein